MDFGLLGCDVVTKVSEKRITSVLREDRDCAQCHSTISALYTPVRLLLRLTHVSQVAKHLDAVCRRHSGEIGLLSGQICVKFQEQRTS